MTDSENTNSEGTNDAGTENSGERENLSALASDVAHPFDQTNGIVEGLEGDENDPEKADDRVGNDPQVPIAGPMGGQQGMAAVRPNAADDVDDGERSPDTNYPDAP
jgi:hypothetical protein